MVDRRWVVRDKASGRLQAFEQAGPADRLPAVGYRPVDLPMEDAVAPVDEAGRIAKGARIGRELARGGGRCDGRVGDRAQLDGSMGPPAGRGRAAVRAAARSARAI